MADVSLKTDFKDGDILYDYHLNNNFAAIQAALGAMNKIVWQDNADSVVTFRGTTEELVAREIINGQILYDTTTGESYIDYDGKRISTGSGNVISIGNDEPTNPATQLWIDTDTLDAKGTEVTNDMSTDNTEMSPSVDAVKKYVKNAVNDSIYSTDEVIVGEWFGETKYRKIYRTTNIAFNDYTTIALPSDVEVVEVSGYLKRTDNRLDKYSTGTSVAQSLMTLAIRVPGIEIFTSDAFRDNFVESYFIVDYVKNNTEEE